MRCRRDNAIEHILEAYPIRFAAGIVEFIEKLELQTLDVNVIDEVINRFLEDGVGVGIGVAEMTAIVHRAFNKFSKVLPKLICEIFKIRKEHRTTLPLSYMRKITGDKELESLHPERTS